MPVAPSRAAKVADREDGPAWVKAAPRAVPRKSLVPRAMRRLRLSARTPATQRRCCPVRRRARARARRRRLWMLSMGPARSGSSIRSSGLAACRPPRHRASSRCRRVGNHGMPSSSSICRCHRRACPSRCTHSHRCINTSRGILSSSRGPSSISSRCIRSSCSRCIRSSRRRHTRRCSSRCLQTSRCRRNSRCCSTSRCHRCRTCPSINSSAHLEEPCLASSRTSASCWMR
mmetsp:Transcript_60079/g.168422  ORF Transcript_60079/g.168422 Transcript_60079/m.168422 type:complete len:231 (-) Transcript_60079:2002-2694(-)